MPPAFHPDAAGRPRPLAGADPATVAEAAVERLAVLEPATIAGFHGAALHLDDEHAAIAIDEDEVPLPFGAGVVVDTQGVPGDLTGGQAGL